MGGQTSCFKSKSAKTILEDVYKMDLVLQFMCIDEGIRIVVDMTPFRIITK